MTAKNAKLALTEAILEFRKHEHDPENLRQTAEEGYAPVQGELSFVQKDDPEARLISVYCEKCTKLVEKATPSRINDVPRICPECKKAETTPVASTVQNTVSPPAHVPTCCTVAMYRLPGRWVCPRCPRKIWDSVCVACNKNPAAIQICTNLFNQQGYCRECWQNFWRGL